MKNNEEHLQLLESIPKKLGIDFLPCIFGRLADKPQMLTHIWNLVEVSLLQGKLHRLTKEMIFIVTANVKKCRYCSDSHKAFAKNLGLSDQLVNCLDGDLRYIEPISTRHILEFSRALAANTEFNSESKFDVLLKDGFSQVELEEVIFTVGVASMITTLANGMSLNESIDEGFYKILAS